MPTRPVSERQRVQVEQAIAFGHSDAWMRTNIGVTPRQVALVRQWMDAANADKPARPTSERQHGTYYGYRQHLTDRTRPCTPCRKAYAEQRRNERGTAVIDEYAVQRAVSGAPPERLSAAEKREAIRRLRGHHYTVQAIADRLGTTRRSVERHIAALREGAA